MTINARSLSTTILPLLLAFAALACKNDNIAPPADLAFHPPVFRGIAITSGDPTPRGEWRAMPTDRFTRVEGVQPGSGSFAGLRVALHLPGGSSSTVLPVICQGGIGIPREISVPTPYPNPAPYLIHFMVELPFESSIYAWVSEAVPPGITGENTESMGGSVVPVYGLKGVAVYQRQAPAGYLDLEWSGCDDAGNAVRPGYFRFFVSIDGALYSRDFIFYRNRAELPPRLQEKLLQLGL